MFEIHFIMSICFIVSYHRNGMKICMYSGNFLSTWGRSELKFCFRKWWKSSDVGDLACGCWRNGAEIGLSDDLERNGEDCCGLDPKLWGWFSFWEEDVEVKLDGEWNGTQFRKSLAEEFQKLEESLVWNNEKAWEPTSESALKWVDWCFFYTEVIGSTASVLKKKEWLKDQWGKMMDKIIFYILKIWSF